MTKERPSEVKTKNGPDSQVSGRDAAVLGLVVVVALALGYWLFFKPSDGLSPALTVEQAAKQKVEEQKGDREVLAKLEKEVGPDHPQVKQMKMELGDIPFPTNK